MTGNYPVQPIFAGDLAAQAIVAGSRGESFITDAAEPEKFTFEKLLRLLASVVGALVRLVHTPLLLGFALTRLVGLLLRDVVLTHDEVDGLMAGLLTSSDSPTGQPSSVTGHTTMRAFLVVSMSPSLDEIFDDRLLSRDGFRTWSAGVRDRL